MYSSSERQAASSLCQVTISGSEPSETEELMRAREAMISPWSSSSVLLVMAERVGEETQVGGERELAYSPVTTY